jgi:SAM-dependent methyltransferase
MAYLMESPSEGTRLRAKTDLRAVEEELELTGLCAGAVALDAGCASGAVTSALSALVGPGGRVYGIDLSQDRLGQAKATCPGATFLRGDLGHLPLATASVDYALCRLVLEYIPEPQPLVSELVRVARPGGRVVLVDVDGYGAFHHPLTDERREAVQTIGTLLERTGFDAFVGRKLHGFLRAAGVERIAVHLRPYHLKVGSADSTTLSNWTYKLQTLAKLGHWALGREAYERAAGTVLEMLRDPEVLSYSTLFLVAGTRPQ